VLIANAPLIEKVLRRSASSIISSKLVIPLRSNQSEAMAKNTIKMVIADRQSWKNSPPPEEREDFNVDWTFPAEIGERMMAGHIPEGMDDRWFILMENGWLLFHRSWTGNCIFGLKVGASQEDVTINQGWVSRKTDEYGAADIQRDVDLAHTLVRDYFLMPPSPPVSPFMAAD